VSENNRIGHVARRQSRLGGFAPSPSPKSIKDSSFGGDDNDDDDDSSGSSYDDEMTTSQ